MGSRVPAKLRTVDQSDCSHYIQHRHLALAGWTLEGSIPPRSILPIAIGVLFLQCEQSFKLRIRWKGDIALVGGVAHNVSPLTLVLRMWTSRAEITASLRGSISRSEDKLQQYDHLSRLLSMAGLWPQLSRSPDKLLDNRVMSEIFPLSMLVSDVESSSRCIFWNDSLRKRLDGIALDG